VAKVWSCFRLRALVTAAGTTATPAAATGEAGGERRG
jgi:hypothetical protein